MSKKGLAQANNMMMFELKKGRTDWLANVLDNYSVLKKGGIGLCILASSDENFRYRKSIHVWIHKEIFDNVNFFVN